MGRRAERAARKGGTVRLRPANPFDLIRLIASSQNDPRKAVAELVQNSLDAGAGSITITRLRRQGSAAISILDDGTGVFPSLVRREALNKIATNIGHSFKRGLSAEERRRQMMLGKYGIGILGFWSVGEELEMRTRVAGSEVWALRLFRDRETAEVLRLPQGRIPFEGETWTELVIRGVHPAANRQVVGRRLGDYLASELRGQLLERKVKLRVIDRLARGTARKDFLVVPRRFRGRSILKVPALEVPGHSPARIEISYFEGEEGSRPAVALTCGGAVVCADLAAIEGYDLDRPPWSAGCLEGVVEFPDLEVSPATRRGFLPGPASDALFAALRSVEEELRKLLDMEQEKRLAEEEQDLVREIRKAFQPLARNLPQYDFFEIAGRDHGAEETGEDGQKLGRREDGAPETPEETASEVVEEGDEPEPPAEILPPGPLARVRIVPRRSRLLPGAVRTLQAKATDETGRRIVEGLEFVFSLEGAGALSAEGERASFTAPEEPGTAVIRVEVREGTRTATAEAVVEVVEMLSGERPDAGIPNPERVVDPKGDWRSRVLGRRWEYNAAHPDYQAARDDPKRRLRYLVHLFAKEIVLRNYGEQPQDERLLERMVEVLTHIRARG